MAVKIRSDRRLLCLVTTDTQVHVSWNKNVMILEGRWSSVNLMVDNDNIKIGVSLTNAPESRYAQVIC